MNCKIIFTSLWSATASTNSPLMLQLSMLLKQQGFSVSISTCDLSSPLSAAEIDSALTANELVIVPDSSSNILTSPLADAVLKNIGTLKGFEGYLPVEYLSSETGDRCGYIVKNYKHSLVILSGFEGNGFKRSLSSLSGYLSSITGRYTCVSSLGIIGNSKGEIIRAIDNSLPSLEYVLTGSAEDYCLCFACTATRTQTAQSQINEYEKQLNKILGICAHNNSEHPLNETVVNMLKASKTTISTAESCTGGLVAKLLTDVSGSSEIFEFGVEAYSNRVKIEALGIDGDIILDHGAVSAEVAKEMALSVRDMAECSLGLSITGVAGPSTSEGKPVGTVYISLTNGEKSWIRLLNASGPKSRDDVRNSAARIALDLVRRYLIVGPELDGACSGTEITFLKRQPGNNDISNGLADYSCAITKDEQTFESNIDPTEDYILSLDEAAADENLPVLTKVKLGLKDIFSAVTTKCSTWFKITKDFTADKLSAFKSSIQNHKAPNTPTGWDKTVNKLHLSFVLPVSSDKIKTFIGKCVILLVAVAFLLTAVIFTINTSRRAAENKLMQDLRERWSIENNSETDSEGKFTSFKFLTEHNEDTVGWFRIQGVDLSYPVVSAPLNNAEYYKNHNFLGSRSKLGALYTAYGTGLEKGKTPANTVIYGNNCADNSMFGSLKEYRNLRYYKSHSRIHFKSLFNQSYYNIFAIYIISDNPKDDNGYIYDYTKNDFDSTTDFNAWIQEARARSLIVTDFDVNFDDRILTLVTDSDDFKGAKLVIVAREFRDDEKYSIDDTKGAKVNPNPLYPQKWYDVNGGRSPYGAITSSTFTGATSTNDVISEVIDGGIIIDEEEYTENNSGIISNFGTGNNSYGPTTTSLGTTVVTSSKQSVGSSSSSDASHNTTSTTETSSEAQSSSSNSIPVSSSSLETFSSSQEQNSSSGDNSENSSPSEE